LSYYVAGQKPGGAGFSTFNTVSEQYELGLIVLILMLINLKILKSVSEFKQ
jgi:hypothetical protein